MRKNDLIFFDDDGSWTDSVAGKIGLVLEVRPYHISKRKEEEWLCLIDGHKTSIFTSGLGITHLSSEED